MTVANHPIVRRPGPANARVEVPEVRSLHYDLDERPFLVLLETTRACDLACTHCRAEAQSERDPCELTTAEVTEVLDDLAGIGSPRPIVVLTGGDPFKRDDLTELIAHGSAAGLAMAVSPSGTPLATEVNLAAVRAAGAGAVSFSLDGPEAATHDAFRGVPGSFALTVDACRAALRVGLRLQVNSTITASTVDTLPEMARLVRELGAGLWSVFFLVPTGRGRQLGALGPDEIEDVLHLLADASASMPLKTTEAPQYRRVLHQRALASPDGSTGERGALYHRLHDRLLAVLEQTGGLPTTRPLHGEDPTRSRRAPLAVGAGSGVVFVSHTGEVFPSGFLPLAVGNVRERPLTEHYRMSPVLRGLRDRDRLGGKCGRCEFRQVCGGSRSQAFAATGDPMDEDPNCGYQPAG
ncbi:MAG: TIGR04053 family radical SAM/SPASM domain-containing protein [Acidimicrobiales bacterium]